VKEASIKYTTVLPQACLYELKAMADNKIIPSVSQGIRTAVEEFVKNRKQYLYEKAMQEAAADGRFMERTMNTYHDFSAVDAEGDETW